VSVTVPADTRDAAVIAEEIAAIPAHSVSPEVARCTRLLKTLKDAGAPCGLLTGQRDRFYPGGPIASNRFR